VSLVQMDWELSRLGLEGSAVRRVSAQLGDDSTNTTLANIGKTRSENILACPRDSCLDRSFTTVFDPLAALYVRPCQESLISRGSNVRRGGNASWEDADHVHFGTGCGRESGIERIRGHSSANRRDA